MQQSVIIGLLMVLITGCFEIAEDLTIKKDGSGSWLLAINASQSKTQLNAVADLDSFAGFPVPNQQRILSEMDHIQRFINEIEGLNAAWVRKDFNDYLFELKVNFETLEQLQNAIDTFYSTKPRMKVPVSLSFQGGKFVRQVHYEPYHFNRWKKQTKTSFDDVSITSVIRFEQTIAQTNHPKTRISGNKKACMTRFTGNQILSDSTCLEQTVILNP